MNIYAKFVFSHKISYKLIKINNIKKIIEFA
ncbi:hypothetical protein WwAna1778 [Wolbachia endosymbiont of Drosophila ananassae]|nr:hypothetical protein WwAna1776 [Wolbachia endosymbiont of Drosophila ananassae]EAL59156.1 hypothetical protein WwAna1778 [Wolbachia endosymbiont of Drosophila ananassae]